MPQVRLPRPASVLHEATGRCDDSAGTAVSELRAAYDDQGEDGMTAIILRHLGVDETTIAAIVQQEKKRMGDIARDYMETARAIREGRAEYNIRISWDDPVTGERIVG